MFVFVASATAARVDMTEIISYDPCRAYIRNEVRPISKISEPSSTSVGNNSISARGDLPEIILKLFHLNISQHVQCR